MPSTTLTIDQLELSPFNVRTNQEDSNATSAMEASLLKRGQIMPLSVHPMKGRKGVWGVFAGGRRYRAFKNLIARGDLPADHPIDVVVRDLGEAELLELSLSENLIRRDLRDYEIAAAVLRAHKRGESPEQLAEALGQRREWVVRALRIAQLAPPVWEGFVRGEVSYDQAKAFGATDSHELQAAVFQELWRWNPELRTPDAIRARLGVNDREQAKLLRFVGEVTYRAAGGRFELDLFAEAAEQRGRAADPEILRRLVDERVAAERERLRRLAGREVRLIPEPPRGEYGTDWSLQLFPKAGPGGALDVPDGVVAMIAVNEQGEPEISWWWESRKAKHGDKGRSRTTANRPAEAAAALQPYAHEVIKSANGAIKEEQGLTAEGVEIFRSIRRALMRGFLVWNARAGRDVAVDLLVWSQVRHAADGERDRAAVGMAYQAGVSADPIHARGHLDALPATRVWEDARRELLARPAFADPDRAAAFRAYRREPAGVKLLAAAVAAGMALERSLNAPGTGYEIPVHDAVAAECGMTGVHTQSLRQLWEPTPELLARIPREQLLGLAERFVEPSILEGWRKLKAAELPPLVASMLDGSRLVIRKMGDVIAAKQWVHELLTFDPAARAPESEGGSDGSGLANNAAPVAELEGAVA